jgi:cysteine-rich repeat protein
VADSRSDPRRGDFNARPTRSYPPKLLLLLLTSHVGHCSSGLGLPRRGNHVGLLGSLVIALAGTWAIGCGDGGGSTGSSTSSSSGAMAACGNGVVDSDEECDDGMNNNDTGACTTGCKAAKCGDGLVESGTEECDEGTNNSDTGACTLWCKLATCGDELVQANVEECDDGQNNGDTAACTAACKSAKCGDGLVQANVEDCDDGVNNADTAACTSACKAAACGDGLVRSDVEECDEGMNNADTAACTSACKSATCGDGFVQMGVEGCDLGANNSDMGMCTSMCKSASCGDGLVQSGVEQCDLGANNSNTAACTSMCNNAACGDGFVQMGVEQCDLGGNNSNTGVCTSACKNAACGDGFVQAGVEQCDLGANNSNTAACTAACKTATCGDGFVQAGVEQCDLGASNSNTGTCTLACKNAACGDGFVQAGESCDDGNMVNGDGCNTNCIVSGTPIFTRTYNSGGTANDQFNSVKVDANGNIILGGSVTVAGQDLNGMVAKYDANGSLLWMRTHNNAFNGTDEVTSVAVDAQGNVIALGYEQLSATNVNIWIRKYDPNGNTIWTQSYTGIANDGIDLGYGVATNSVGDILMAATVSTVGAGRDIVIAKLAGLNGSYTWSEQVNGTGNMDDEALSIAVDANNRVYASGYSVGNTGNKDVWVRKYQDNGVNSTALWTRTFNGSLNNDDFGFGVAFDASGGLVVTGAEAATGGNYNIWLRKYDASGNVLWTQTHNGPANVNDLASAVSVDAQGNVIVCGHEGQTNATFDIWVRKYDSNGVVRWTQSYNGNADQNDYGVGVTVDANGFIYAVGRETTLAQGENGWLRKFNP